MNIAAQVADDGIARVNFTVDDVHRMLEAGILTEDDRIELVEGDLIVMAAKHIGHDRIKLELNRAFAKFLPEQFLIGVEATIQLADNILLEPDLAILPRTLYQGDPKSFAQPRGEDIPLLIEVAVSSLNYDRRTKARLYARHGVREFWVIDANALTTWMHTRPSGDAWDSIVERKADDPLTPAAFPTFSIKLSDI